MRKTKKRQKEVKIYDLFDTTNYIDKKHPLKLSDIGYKLPRVPPTQVVSIRIPTWLLNQLKSYSHDQDIAYHALIKLILSEGIKKRKSLGRIF